MIRDLLTLTTVQVRRKTLTMDGQGGIASTTTVLTTLSRAAIWQAGGSKSALADKIAAISTHVLAVETGTYTWSVDDMEVVYGGATYRITAPPDDVFNSGELTVVGLERTV